MLFVFIGSWPGIGAPLNVSVMGRFAAKPEPFTFTVAPTIPCVRLRVILEIVLKVFEALCVVSFAAKVCVPAKVVCGTVYAKEKLPVLLETKALIALLSKLTVTVEECAKPEPLIVTEPPSIAFTGVKVIPACTVKVVKRTSPKLSVA